MNNTVLISKYSFFILLWINFAEYPGIDTTGKGNIILTCNIWRNKGYPGDSKTIFWRITLESWWTPFPNQTTKPSM